MAFYLHLLDQDPEGVRFVWDEFARTRPDDFPRRVASFIRRFSLSGMELKIKSLSSFGFLLATRGGYPPVSQSDVHFFGNGYTREKSCEFNLSLYALKRGHGLLFRTPFLHSISY